MARGRSSPGGSRTLDLDRTPDFYENVLFKDPNGIQLEYGCFTRNPGADDARMQHRAEIPLRRLGLEDAAALASPRP